MLNHNAELGKLGKEVGEGLTHARGVSQADSRHPQSKHAKAHCDAVIAVGLDLRPAQGARIDPERVTALLHVGAAFGQLGTQGFDTFAFLDSQPAQVDEQRGSWSKGRQHIAVIMLSARSVLREKTGCHVCSRMRWRNFWSTCMPLAGAGITVMRLPLSRRSQ